MKLFQPLGARCLVKPTEKPPLSTIIVAPDASKGKSDEGVIIALGTEPYGRGKTVANSAGELIQLKIGDSVLFQQYTGSEFKIGGIDYRVLAYDDLLGVIHTIPDEVFKKPEEPKILTPNGSESKRIVSPAEAAGGL